MIKVIKAGTKRRAECKICGAILEYNREDVCRAQRGINEYAAYIICPCCEEEVRVSLQW